MLESQARRAGGRISRDVHKLRGVVAASGVGGPDVSQRTGHQSLDLFGLARVSPCTLRTPVCYPPRNLPTLAAMSSHWNDGTWATAEALATSEPVSDGMARVWTSDE